MPSRSTSTRAFHFCLTLAFVAFIGVVAYRAVTEHADLGVFAPTAALASIGSDVLLFVFGDRDTRGCPSLDERMEKVAADLAAQGSEPDVAEAVIGAVRMADEVTQRRQIAGWTRFFGAVATMAHANIENLDASRGKKDRMKKSVDRNLARLLEKGTKLAQSTPRLRFSAHKASLEALMVSIGRDLSEEIEVEARRQMVAADLPDGVTDPRANARRAAVAEDLCAGPANDAESVPSFLEQIETARADGVQPKDWLARVKMMMATLP